MVVIKNISTFTRESNTALLFSDIPKMEMISIDSEIGNIWFVISIM